MARRLSKAQRALLDDLAGGTEIAEALGVSRALVNVWANRSYLGFPDAVVTLSSGRFWLLSEVKAWHEQARP